MSKTMAARGRHNALLRYRSPDDPELAQARRALELARTEDAIRQAIESAPPLDAATLDRLRSLIPASTDLLRPVPASDGGNDASAA